MNKELIELIANLALSLSLVVAVIFGIAEARTAARDRRERLTIDTLHNLQTREFAEHINYINWNTMPSTQEGLRALPFNDQVTYIQFGQEMESLGILVAEKIINIDLVDKTLGSFVVIAWDKYKPMYMDIREKTPDPFLGEYFQWLAERIDERMRSNPRKPFHIDPKR